MEQGVLRVTGAEAARDMVNILRRVQAGTEVVMERDAQW